MNNSLIMLERLANMAQMPLFVFSRGELVLKTEEGSPFLADPRLRQLADPKAPEESRLDESGYPIVYLLHCVKGLRCILGPFSQLRLDYQTVHGYAAAGHFSVSPGDCVPTVPLDRALDTLSMLHYILTGEERSFEDLDTQFRNFLTADSPLRSQDADSRLQWYRLSNTENGRRRTSRETEIKTLECIRLKDVQTLKKLIRQATPMEVRVLAASAFTQEEYLTVVCIALICRTAIAEGVPHYKSYEISEMLMLRVSECTRLWEFRDLRLRTMEAFMMAMDAEKEQQIRSIPLENAKKYIIHNLNSPLTLDEVAAQVKISKSQLMALVRRYEQMTVMDFIWSERIHAAQSMLRHTEASVAQISGYFYYSSPSHFSHLFKKYTGQTPSQYRKQYYSAEL